MPVVAPAEAETLFEAVIVPHRSLSSRGYRVLVAAICLLSTLIAVRFWLIGAWPVIGFSAVEIGLAVVLLTINARQARGTELVMLTPDELRIVRSDARGRCQERVLAAAWLNVVLEERPGRAPGLLLVARDVREEIATTLGEAERRDLATALAGALRQARNPRFYNPQLEEQA
jgi:uncharacterized membrane protein